jgi:hypothetical protein
MTSWARFAISFEHVGYLEKGLAVLGGAVVGGFLVGLLVRFLVKALSAQKVPPKIMLIVRLLGAVAAGWLVALWVWGGGGPGIGGSGGIGFGGGTGGNKPPATESHKDQVRSDKGENAGREGVLRVEVLTNLAVEKLLGKEAVRAQRYYHVLSTEEKDLLTLDELKEIIRKRAKEQPPPRRLDIVTGPESPVPELPRVNDLTRWAKDQDLVVAFPER